MYHHIRLVLGLNIGYQFLIDNMFTCSSLPCFIYLFFFQRKGGFFVDLFVRVSNQVAVNMYKQLGYSVYRTVLEYYSASNGEPDEDAYGKCLFCLKLNGKVLMLSIPRVVCMGFVLFFFFRMKKI